MLARALGQATGETQMLLESLTESVPAGVFFGSGNPNNWGIKDRIEQLCEGNPDALEVTRLQFSLYAQLHARHWRSEALFEKPWLRGADWYRGKGEAGWASAQKMASTGWTEASKQRLSGESEIVWDDHLVACLDASFAKVDWIDYVSQLRGNPYVRHRIFNCWAFCPINFAFCVFRLSSGNL